MKKLLTILALTFGLLFGSVAAISPASADDHLLPCADIVNLEDFTGECDPVEEDETIRCTDVVNLEDFTGVCIGDPVIVNGPSEPAPPVTCATDQTATEYRTQLATTRTQVVALTAKVDRLQTVADRRAKTIQRLRAKIRKLR